MHLGRFFLPCKIEHMANILVIETLSVSMHLERNRAGVFGNEQRSIARANETALLSSFLFVKVWGTKELVTVTPADSCSAVKALGLNTGEFSQLDLLGRRIILETSLSAEAFDIKKEEQKCKEEGKE
ncbi:hypothetical protein V6N12_049888 [Hibiscus sabdariffa]|uniref:Uncharacterized protein n=1 Tax=Hibiscus sabdariffa TaxID=183260 RepID=A0ABR2GAU3_9ROSI